MATVRSHPRHSKSRRRAARPASTSGSVRIVIADDQAIDRAALVALLEGEPGFEIAAEVATLDEAIRRCRALRPDALVLALNIAGQETCSAIPAIRAAVPDVPIVALSERGAANCLVLNPPYRQKTAAELNPLCTGGLDCLQLAAAQGAMATVRRSAEPEHLFRAIRSAAAGEAWYDPTTARGMLAGGRSRHGSELLSASEVRVAALIADGRSNKEISSALRISEATVKKHVGHILGKLAAANRTQAVARARVLGLLRLGRHRLLAVRSGTTRARPKTPPLSRLSADASGPGRP
jgi:DNA-binding NarL/FixJ family response regulator